MKSSYKVETKYPYFCDIYDLPIVADQLVSLSASSNLNGVGKIKKKIVKQLYKTMYQTMRFKSDAKIKFFDIDHKDVPVDISDTAYINLATIHRRRDGYAPELACIMSLLAPHVKLFCDIGANLGFFSFLFATHKGFKGHVNAFEVNPPTYKHVNDTVVLAGLKDVITTHAFGLSNENTEGKIKVGMHSGLASVTTDSGLDTVDIFLRKFDDLKFKNVDLMKIDVEGHELSVLEGAEKTLEQNKPFVVMESWFSDDQPKDMLAPLEFLEKLGYELYYPQWDGENIDELGGLSLSQLSSKARSEIKHDFDVIAVPKERKDIIESIFNKV